jgi:DNA-binding MurR/RpiR family transcriptional regulator
MERINDQQILAALIASGSIRAAAKSAGVAESTIRNRMADPDFRAKYDAMRGELLQEAAQGLTARLESATATMSEIMEDGQNPASVRVSAADAVLRHALRYVEAADILRRLDALEAAAQEAEP